MLSNFTYSLYDIGESEEAKQKGVFANFRLAHAGESFAESQPHSARDLPILFYPKKYPRDSLRVCFCLGDFSIQFQHALYIIPPQVEHLQTEKDNSNED